MKITYTTPFTMIANKIIQSKDLKVYEKMIYIVLCSHANQHRGCFPSYKTIANEAGCCERQAKIIIRSLEDKGLIIVTRRKNDKGNNESNIYEIVVDGACDAQGSACDAPTGGESDAQGSASGAHEQYESNNNKYINNIHLTIDGQDEIDGIIENAELDILDKQTDRDLFEEVIRRMYCSKTITVHGNTYQQSDVRKRLINLNATIICSAFDKYRKELPKRPISFLTSLLYNEMCECEAVDLQCQRTSEVSYVT